jgi:predicted nucleic acid-binding protein
MPEILNALDAEFVIEDYVLRSECSQIWTFENRPDRVAQTVSLAPLVRSGVLKTVEIDDSEAATAVILAHVGLDDGEARTGAVAIHRGLVLATDDKAARRVFIRNYQRTGVIGTPTLMRGWAEVVRVETGELRTVLETLEFCGNYVPSPRDPDTSWWNQAVGR